MPALPPARPPSRPPPALQANALTRGGTSTLGVAPLPGSTQVLDRRTNQLKSCTGPAVCPFAKQTRLANGTTAWVNYAPYSAFGGWSAAISSLGGWHRPADCWVWLPLAASLTPTSARRATSMWHTRCRASAPFPCAHTHTNSFLFAASSYLAASSQQRHRVYQFYSYIAQPNNSWHDVLDPNSGIDPSRRSQLETEGPNFQRWTAAGYEEVRGWLGWAFGPVGQGCGAGNEARRLVGVDVGGGCVTVANRVSLG